ncbi:hypothetical protein CDL12_22630 [Handroanthus impetiginosus]|uniref:Uncharacterized protein n=1 Tax=Handroanthus impetiginosus TaxID=429701 RepID=A0A2G9GHR6_9LAMI|nr:hypothetical protein CDL12_22630 [Handroanthus impetiginosus]
MAASKLLNLRTPAIQNLMRGQSLHPTAAAPFSRLLQRTSTSPALPDAQSLNLIHPQNGSTNHELSARNLGMHASNLHLYLQLPSGPCGVQAYQTYATRRPKADPYEDYDDDDDDEDEDEDDDGDIQDYSGSDFDDDDDDYDDVDEDSDARPRSGGRYRK